MRMNNENNGIGVPGFPRWSMYSKIKNEDLTYGELRYRAVEVLIHMGHDFVLKNCEDNMEVAEEEFQKFIQILTTAIGDVDLVVDVMSHMADIELVRVVVIDIDEDEDDGEEGD